MIPGVLRQYGVRVRLPLRVQLRGQLRVLHSQDLRRQQRRVRSAVHRDGRHRNPRGHLNRGQQRVQPFQAGTLAGNPDHRQGSIRGNGPGQVSRHACRRDQRAESVLPRIDCKSPGLFRCTVC